jgi:LmbE family N-acetylglucosaminyl deacetylase
MESPFGRFGRVACRVQFRTGVLHSEGDSGRAKPGAQANPFSGRHVMVVTAHADDETLGAGAAIAEARLLTIVYVTDGVKSARAARRRGFASIGEYARVRVKEARLALSLIGVEARFVELAVRNRRAAFNIDAIARSVGRLVSSAGPEIVLTHAFEGGHPDHDATAMAVHMAIRNSGSPIPVFEMAGYHAAGGKDVYGSLIPHAGAETIRFELSQDARAMKKAMLAAFVSQRSAVSRFPLEAEMFRSAPEYDFSRRPHPGPLYYECHRLGMRWRTWRFLAARARHRYENPAEGISRYAAPFRVILARVRWAAHFVRQPRILARLGTVRSAGS